MLDIEGSNYTGAPAERISMERSAGFRNHAGIAETGYFKRRRLMLRA